MEIIKLLYFVFIYWKSRNCNFHKENIWMKIFLLVFVVCASILGANGVDIADVNLNCSFQRGSNCPGKFNVSTNCSVACDGVLEDYETDEIRCYNSCKCIFHEGMCLEGDIRIRDSNRDVMNYLYKNKSDDGGVPSPRALTSITNYFWPIDALTGVYYVPYVNNVNDALTVNGLNAAIADFNSMTCIRMIARTTETNYINIISDSGCYSYIGMIGGAQNLSLGTNCHFKEVILHEVMHALGFSHEQSRPDRDNYVTVISANILAGFEDNFEIAMNIDSRGSPYDYRSLMHYGRNFFSRNPATLNTLVTTNQSFQTVIGTGTDFSVQDLFQINAAYGCTQTQTAASTAASATTSTSSSTVASTTTEADEVTTPSTISTIPGNTFATATSNATENYNANVTTSTSSSSRLSAFRILALCSFVWTMHLSES